MSESRILLIDSDAVRAERTVSLLEFMDFNPRWVADGADINPGRHRHDEWMAVMVGSAQDAAQANSFFDWLADAKLPPPVLLMEGSPTAFAQAHGLHEANVWALDPPLRHAQLESLLRRASLKRLDAEHQASVQQDSGPTGDSAAVTQLRRLIDQVAAFDTTVLVLGESGTGKEVVARSIHQHSPRRDGPFVAINCGAIPPDLLESELFGHEKGAFTGALSTRKGRFEMAEGGTLLLDEIGDMSLPMQVKLLRAIQEKTVRPVGASSESMVDVRILSATHKDLGDLVTDGRFRHDLYYRINVIELRVPPLRERGDDLPQLAAAIVARLAHSHGRPIPLLTQSALDALHHYSFPGNVRELENILERALALAENDQISATDLRLPAHGSHRLAAPPASEVMAPNESILDIDPASAALPSYIEQLERAAIQKALEDNRWNKTKTAAHLGITFRALRYKLKKWGME